jgi:hypothetical protein
MDKYRLLAPLDFDVRYPNLCKTKQIPSYHGVLQLEDECWLSTSDERIKDFLVSKYDFQLVYINEDPPVETKPVSHSIETPQHKYRNLENKPMDYNNISELISLYSEVRTDDIYEELDIKLPSGDIFNMEDKKEYCKFCGKALKKINLSHLNTHDMDMEEYEALPVMVPDIAMKLYWESEELQECFPEPMNLLGEYKDFANYLDWVKLEGTRKYKEIAEYFNVPHPRTGPINRVWEYCKICGAPFDFGSDHYKTHGTSSKNYASLRRYIPDILMDMWHKHADLRRAFPNPMKEGAGHGPFTDFLDWCKRDGVRKHPHLRNYFKGKK